MAACTLSVLGLCWLLSSQAVAAQSKPLTTLVSTSSAGVQGDANSMKPSCSADGRFVAFESDAANLVPDDGNGWPDVFWRDLWTGQTLRVSISMTGGDSDWGSNAARVSADGRFVVFLSAATNLVPNDTNGEQDVFVRDLRRGVTSLVSVSSQGEQANLHSLGARISQEGRFVTFYTGANNLVPGDINNTQDVFVRDCWLLETTRVSVSAAGVQTNNPSVEPALSADGRFVGFISNATNLVDVDANGFMADVFVKDRLTGQVSLVSVSSSGVQSNGWCYGVSLSADGRHVAFSSSAYNLVPVDLNGKSDVFVHDRATGSTVVASIASSGAQADDHSSFCEISADGGRVVFQSEAENLVAGDTNGDPDIYLHELASGKTVRVSVSSTGQQASTYSQSPCINASGRMVFFSSSGEVFHSPDANGVFLDIFARAPIGL